MIALDGTVPVTAVWKGSDWGKRKTTYGRYLTMDGTATEIVWHE